jgi:hypothetical protein
MSTLLQNKMLSDIGNARCVWWACSQIKNCFCVICSLSYSCVNFVMTKQTSTNSIVLQNISSILQSNFVLKLFSIKKIMITSSCKITHYYNIYICTIECLILKMKKMKIFQLLFNYKFILFQFILTACSPHLL